MKNFLLFFYLFSSQAIFSQIYKPKPFPEKIDSKYLVSAMDEYKILKTNGKYEDKLDEYYFECALSKSEMFSNGEVYFNWDTLEKYLNAILTKIMPSNLSSNKIHAFIGRSSEINAYCLYDGSMIVNIGLIAEVKSEAALAFIMAHELGHFINNHQIKQFKFKQLIEQQAKKTELKKNLDVMNFYQNCERESDRIGFELTNEAGYDIKEALSNFELFIKQKKNFERMNKSKLVNTDSVIINTEEGGYMVNSLDRLLSSHPDVYERHQMMETYINITEQKNPEKFKVNESYFYKVRKAARLETVMLEFNEHNYRECLKRTFFYYLFEPEEITYSYLACECIRRLCLINYQLKRKGFLTEKLQFAGFNDNQGILHDLRYICLDTISFMQIKAFSITKRDTLLFETYHDAFNFFCDELSRKNNPEGLLSRALYETNIQQIEDNLNKYLASSNTEYKSFAEAYKNGTLIEKVKKFNKEYVLIPKVSFYYHSDYSKYPPYIFGYTKMYNKKTESIGIELADQISNYISLTNKNIKAFSIPQLNKENFNFKHKYIRVLNASMLTRSDDSKKNEVVHRYKQFESEDYDGRIDLFRLDPESWNFFMDQKINKINYLNYTRHESREARKMRTFYTVMIIPSLGLSSIFAAGTVVNYKQAKLISYDPKIGEVFEVKKAKIYKLNKANGNLLFEILINNRDKQILKLTKQ